MYLVIFECVYPPSKAFIVHNLRSKKRRRIKSSSFNSNNLEIKKHKKPKKRQNHLLNYQQRKYRNEQFDIFKIQEMCFIMRQKMTTQSELKNDVTCSVKKSKSPNYKNIYRCLQFFPCRQVDGFRLMVC